MTDHRPPIYFDYAAATPLDPRVGEAMAPYDAELFYNPSARYEAARAVKRDLEAARGRVAVVLGVKPAEIIFTAGATESINMALFGVARKYPSSSILALATEHQAVLACLEGLRREGHSTELIPVTKRGQVSGESLARAVTDDTVLVTIAYANSEIGTIQPLAELSAAVARIRRDRQSRGLDLPLLLHTDASAAVGSLDLHVSRLGVDLLTLNAGKFYGPKQSGALYVRAGLALAPLIYGGGQERGLRGGTPSVGLAVGLATALELAAAEQAAMSHQLYRLTDQLWRGIQACLPEVRLNGPQSQRLAGNLNITIPGVEGETLVLYLENAGFLVATGSACSASDARPSHVLRALGITDAEASQSLRLTLGRGTTPEHIEKLLSVLPGVVARVRELS